MNQQNRLPSTAAAFLLVVALLADGIRILLDLILIGFIVGPLIITPIATMIFWITMNHNSVPMFSGKNWASAWIMEAISLTPFPPWTAYTIYLIVQNRASVFTQGIIS